MTVRQKPRVVPYVARWTGEKRPAKVLPGKHGIRLESGTPRDHTGVLWKPVKQARGKGRPEHGEVHSRRQRECMLHLLCQGCGDKASTTEAGTLWLMADQPDWSDWPERAVTTHPPVCVPCAVGAVRECWHLLDAGAVALRVRSSEVCGVYGAEYLRRPDGSLVRLADRVVLFGDPRMRWVLAGQLVRSLHDCTVADLREEFAAYRATA